jgi:hypothetical protein
MHVDRFYASACWLGGFMARQCFSLRVPHPERRTPINQDYAEYCLGELEKAKLKYPTNRIFNFGDTCWKRYLGPQKASAEKETELRN